MSWIRLRQVALVARDLDAVVRELTSAFGIDVAFRDPEVAAFGLRNAVLPVGNEFIEVVSPTRDGTAGGRQLERLGGDGGYMVICHTDDHEAARRRVGDHGVRTVIDADHDGYRLMQLHPADTGGSFLEIDHQPGGDVGDGPWMPAGPDWQRARRTDVVTAVVGADVQSRDAERTAQRWSNITGLDVDDLTLRLDQGVVRFVSGPVETLVGITLSAADRSRAGEQHTICGVTFSLV